MGRLTPTPKGEKRKYFQGQYRIVVRFPMGAIDTTKKVEATITNTRYKGKATFTAGRIKKAIEMCAKWADEN